MWYSQKAEAMVLSVTPWKEADRKYTALTREYGKIEFMGRGAQKAKAKLAAHLEPFARTHVELVVGKRGTTVIGVERIEAFSHLASSWEHRTIATIVNGLLEKTLYANEPDEVLYGEVHDFFTFLNTAPVLTLAHNVFLLGGFLLRVLGHLGYEPELHACLGCREDIHPLAFRWHDARGGLVCTTCAQEMRGEWMTARAIDEEIIALLRFVRTNTYQDFIRMHVKGNHIVDFSACVHDLLRIHVPGYADQPFWQMVLTQDEIKTP